MMLQKYGCLLLAFVIIAGSVSAANIEYNKEGTWLDTLLSIRQKMVEKNVTGKQAGKALPSIHSALNKDFPVETDWLSQDPDKYEMGGNSAPNNFLAFLDMKRDNALEQKLISDAIKSFGNAGAKYNKDLEKLKAGNVPAGDERWLDLFVKICSERRAARLKRLSSITPVIAFVKRHPVKPSFYAYTEGQSDAQAERHFNKNAKLCLLKIKDSGCEVEDLIDAPEGVIRDLDVSYDGQKLLFAWKKSDRQDDYHLYEMDVVSRKIRQLTFGLGVADYEAIYLPDDDIMFSSSRCVETVDCWWTEVSNMYTCDKDGKYLRRLGFDQVHTVHPSVMNNGTVVYTRWDYNDRGQIYPQALFQMNPDGTGQTEYYGNNSWFPTVTDHARAIPGSDKLVAVIHGHHTWQAGELALIDRKKGTQEAAGVQLIAPVRETKAIREDRLGQTREMFRHPYPLSEIEYIVSMSPDNLERNRNPSQLALYWVHADGNRELLTFDPTVSCNNPIPVRPRPRPHVKPSLVDYRKDSGVYFMQDVYIGPGLEGVKRGSIKELRVVALEFRAAGVKNNGSGGEAGGALVCTPIAVGNGSWDVKKILGTTKVFEDGSAMFRVPANTPVYFQAIDDKGHVAQTMRSWSTLMPGEVFGCVGCHEDKLSTPIMQKATMASKAGVQELKPFFGPARGFSFKKEIQPILDKHCIKCHDLDKPDPTAEEKKKNKAFSLKGDVVRDQDAGRDWTMSYVMLTGSYDPKKKNHNAYRGNDTRPVLNWVSSQSRPSMIPPYHVGSAKSGIIKMLNEGHPSSRSSAGTRPAPPGQKTVTLSKEEMDKLCTWIDLAVPFCGDYLEANNWSDQHLEYYMRYQRKRERLASDVRRNTEDLIKKQTGKTVKLPDPEPRYQEYTGGYRNLALNPDDVQGSSSKFPHATSNSECRGEACFAAKNVIDGNRRNRGHGGAFPSWGPDKRDDLWLQIDLGKAYEVDMVAISVRADFKPYRNNDHDSWWKSGEIEFSDGSKEPFTLIKSADAQEIKFKKRKTSWIKITNLVAAEDKWCGISEVEVWGK